MSESNNSNSSSIPTSSKLSEKESSLASNSKSSSSETQSSLASSSSSSGASSQSQAATVPLDDIDYQNSPDEDEDDLSNTCAWGILMSLDVNYFRNCELVKDEQYKFGRQPGCQYVFEKTDGFYNSDKFKNLYLNLSKVHFVVYKQDDDVSEIGYTVHIQDVSTNGTYVDGVLIGKGRSQVLSTCSKISVAGAQNEAFLFTNVKEHQIEKKALPKDFRKKYILENVKLGEGAHGVVRRGCLRNSDTKVAVKIISKGKALSISKDLTYEANLMHAISHPHIVKIEDLYETGTAVYIVLEYLKDGELFDYVKHHGAIPEQICKTWFLQLLEAVDYLHGKDITHRDLKPENVLMSWQDEETCHLKITDFGLSRFVAEQCLMKTLAGTPNYLAPEILRPAAGGYTRSVDCWSLGCILFIMLSGYPPFSGEIGEGSMENQIVEGSYKFVKQLWSNVSKNAIDLVKKLLTVSPEKRITMQGALDHDWFKVESSNKKQKVEE